MNSWNITGNLGNDAETKFTASGDAVVSFSVGVKSGYGDKAKTVWARCSMFGKRGEAVANYLTKGQMVGVVGELSTNEWTNKEGVKQTSIEVRVNDLTLLGKKEGGQQNEPRQQPRNAQGAQRSSNNFDELSSDIPFLAHARGRIGHCM